MDEIASAEGVDRKTVYNTARRAGLPRRQPRQTERNARILERYRAGDLVQQIADEEKVSRPYVSSLARRAGLPCREDWGRRYPVNHCAFDSPDAIGWWLIGLLAADGCVYERGNLITLAQREQDVDVLRAFLAHVGCPDRPLTDISGSERRPWSAAAGRYFEARIFSHQIQAALARHGITPRKSRTLVLGNEAAGQPAVWLGLLDGDGSVEPSGSRGAPRISFYGTSAVMGQCSDYWSTQLVLASGGAPSVLGHRGGLSKVCIYGANAARAADVMLAASPVSLERKRAKLEEIASYRPSPSLSSTLRNQLQSRKEISNG